MKGSIFCLWVLHNGDALLNSQNDSGQVWEFYIYTLKLWERKAWFCGSCSLYGQFAAAPALDGSSLSEEWPHRTAKNIKWVIDCWELFITQKSSPRALGKQQRWKMKKSCDGLMNIIRKYNITYLINKPIYGLMKPELFLPHFRKLLRPGVENCSHLCMSHALSTSTEEKRCFIMNMGNQPSAALVCVKLSEGNHNMFILKW